MITPAELGALVTATKGAIDIFDRLAEPIRRTLTGQPRNVEAEQEEKKWRFKVDTDGQDVVVKQNERVVQTVSGDQLERTLDPHHVKLIEAFESKMQYYADLWTQVYEQKDVSTDPLVNAKVDQQLKQLVKKMKVELLGVLSFLEGIGINLDDHYMHVRYLIQNEAD